MIRLYITRHGQTEWNTQKRFQGHKDSELTPLGKRQAFWLSERLKDLKIQKVYSSPIKRANRTAGILIGDRGIEIENIDGLKEMNFGLWEGMNEEQLKREYPIQFHNFWNSPHKYTPFGGETYDQVKERVAEELENIIKRHYGKDENILIVVHGVVLKLLLSHIEGTKLEQLWDPPYIHPASLSIVEYDENHGFNVVEKADISHYKEEGGQDWK
ncbi:probable phosphoglycerate mutase [Peptoclostridium litorale DSM 5388]|uniref:Phosphoserine phosphatase 1 n=1 Tax=Peptoclostridium litorale DSM 5388 TaxID=1121324 RepID=A0A069RDW7_PEPLI|nr:histidine phosphatase family protein [Peptoclostridium litorale]KDR95221.1 phosphoserine phosphatase 1 [Peptoclostridium litorale DSM 5388]SIN73198.1 probable phosphoglycerate mutase [Peptoclostridium litorale DSM 5388]